MEKAGIYKKIMTAKQNISISNIKKEGYNKYSKYYYFTPDQINKLVFLACQETNLLTLFSLKRDQFGELGELAIIDLETFEKEVITMATAIPSLTATNAAQQLGGCVTYTERYLKMSIFGISDNTLDPDSKNNTKKEVKKDYPEDTRSWLNDKQFHQAVEKIRNNNFGKLNRDEWSKKLFADFKIKVKYKDEIKIELNSPFNEALNK